MGDKKQSSELQPGTIMEHTPTGQRVELSRRKSPDEVHGKFFPGWWNTDGSGLGDFVIDAEDSDWRCVERKQ